MNSRTLTAGNLGCNIFGDIVSEAEGIEPEDMQDVFNVQCRLGMVKSVHSRLTGRLVCFAVVKNGGKLRLFVSPEAAPYEIADLLSKVRPIVPAARISA